MFGSYHEMPADERLASTRAACAARRRSGGAAGAKALSAMRWVETADRWVAVVAVHQRMPAVLAPTATQ
jgi:hypothetical protein